MGKISVASLAKTLGVEPRDAIARLKEIGVDAKTATSQVDEGVVARLTAPQPKDTGTNEVRVASNIIRRRAKIVPAVEEVDEAVVVPDEQPVKPLVVSAPVEAPPVKAPESTPVVETVPEVKERVEIAAVAPVVPNIPVVPVAAVVEAPVATVEPVKPGPNQARILGMMEIPGVTNRPTRVVTKDTPVTPRTAPQRPAQDAAQQRRPASPTGDQRRPAPGADTRRPSPGY
jgi:translation initiation factor IF-2